MFDQEAEVLNPHLHVVELIKRERKQTGTCMIKDK